MKEFELLGIKFDNNLEKMNVNFEDKIEKIEKLLSHWSYRYLTPFGKVTVIKSLALSKLSHVALVIPSPTKPMFKKLESILYTFLWSGKSEKVSRADTKLPEKFGGLGMPDIEQYWLSFKYSWLGYSQLSHIGPIVFLIRFLSYKWKICQQVNFYSLDPAFWPK